MHTLCFSGLPDPRKRMSTRVVSTDMTESWARADHPPTFTSCPSWHLAFLAFELCKFPYMLPCSLLCTQWGSRHGMLHVKNGRQREEVWSPHALPQLYDSDLKLGQCVSGAQTSRLRRWCVAGWLVQVVHLVWVCRRAAPIQTPGSDISPILGLCSQCWYSYNDSISILPLYGNITVPRSINGADEIGAFLPKRTLFPGTNFFPGRHFHRIL